MSAQLLICKFAVLTCVSFFFYRCLAWLARLAGSQFVKTPLFKTIMSHYCHITPYQYTNVSQHPNICHTTAYHFLCHTISVTQLCTTLLVSHLDKLHYSVPQQSMWHKLHPTICVIPFVITPLWQALFSYDIENTCITVVNVRQMIILYLLVL